MTDKVTVVIPARNEIYLQKTIESVLNAAVDPIEVIAVCDGYWPNPSVKDHKYVKLIHHTDPIGQRQSINEAMKISTGKYMIKLDAHCAVAPGFDKVLKEDCKYEWTMVPRMFALDIDKWEPKLLDDIPRAFRRGKATDYMYISHPDYQCENKPYGFRAMYYGKFQCTKTTKPVSDKLIDETMCCMGPCWFMHTDRFWELGGCDEAHGGWGQQGIEVSLKAWLSGGALMVNKKTWFAHWVRSGPIGFPYKMTLAEQQNARKYSRDLWLNDKWPKATRKLQWLADKFQPPTWDIKSATRGEVKEPELDRMDIYSTMYNHIHRRKNDVLWRGVPVWKFPTDLTLYSEVLYERKPDWVVEIGTAKGGSALFYQDMLDLNGTGRVITIDIRDRLETPRDSRIEYIIGNSLDDKVLEQVRNKVSGKVMVVIDGNHSRRHVKWELNKYSPLVTPGQFLVIEDCYLDRGLYGPGEARDWFMSKTSKFKQTNRCEKYIMGMTMGGWLERI